MTDATRRPVVLCILDGWGYAPPAPDNALSLAKLPVYNRLKAECPWVFVQTSGRAVGLPDGQMGNSEVGHMNLGAGRVLVPDLPRIDNAIEDGSLAKNPKLLDMLAKLKASRGTLHLLGLLSPGGVHSHQDHIAAVARLAAHAGAPVAVHAFLDGRDTPPRSALEYLETFNADVAGLDRVRIATVSGRYYAMDRDKRWDRVQLAYDAIVSAKGGHAASAAAAVQASYATGKNDEFVLPAAIGDYAGMRDGDGLLMVNFRADRAREILTALVDPQFDGFPRAQRPAFAAQYGMVEYSNALTPFLPAFFEQVIPVNTLGEVLAARGLKQLRIAETEKYAHVTFFFNGGVETVFPGEDRILVPSPKVATYDQQPEMSAFEVTDRLVEAIGGGKYDVIVVNYANGDMVGHTGVLAAAIKAAEAIDICLGRLENAVKQAGGALLITADHGNLEDMLDEKSGQANTQHTTTDVPCILVNGPAGARLHPGKLADLAPTVLQLMGAAQPAEMTGRSLIEPAAAQRVSA